MKQIYILVALFFISAINVHAQAIDPALCYDGVDDFFNIPNSGNGVLGTNSDNNSFTIEFWTRDDNGVGKHYFSKHSNSTIRKGYFIERTATGTVVAGIANNLNSWSTVTGTTVINDANWHHIAFTYNASNSQIKLYIDATLEATLTGGFTPVFDDSVSARVGGSEYYNSYFSGAFDEVRVWNSVRTIAEIAANKNQAVATAPSDLILNYRFADGTTPEADNSWTSIILDYSNSGSHTNIFNFARMGTCSNWANSVDNGTLSVATFTAGNEFSLYPNPATNVLKVNGLTSIENYTIYNTIGAVINSGSIGNNEEINVSSLTNGLYFLKFENSNAIKFIKK